MNAMPKSSDMAHYEMSGPTLLAAQPPSTTTPQPKGKDWGRIYQHLESRMQGLRMWRYSRWIYWADLAKYILPFRYLWLVVANRMWRDRPVNNAIIDNTATQAMWVCASGLWTGLTNPSRPWFKLGIALPWVELDADGKTWLEDTEKRVYSVLAQSNFYDIMAQAFQDVVVFGSAPVIIYEDSEDVIRCYLPCAGEYYLASGSRLSIDTLAREFTFTVQQIVDMFGIDNCPADVRSLWYEGGGSWSTEFVVAHLIEPNSPLSSFKGSGEVRVVPAKFTFRETYWLRGQNDGGELSRRGFHETPFMCARWKTVSNDPYGRALAEDALGDVKELQLATMRKAEFIEKLVRPPMGADVGMKNEPSSIIPGHVTYTDTTNGKKGFWPLYEVQAPALAPMVSAITAVQERIKECFFVPIFMAITQMEGVQPRNELELSKRDLERLQVLGPFISLFRTDFGNPAIQRVLAILTRRRMLLPMPKSLHGIPLKIEYESMLEVAQQSAEGVALKDFLSVGAQMTQAAQASGQQPPLRIVDLDKAYRRYGDIGGVDPSIIRTEDVVKQGDSVRSKQQAAQQVAAVAPTAVDAAKSLAETPLGGNTALSALMGGGAPPGV